MKLDDFINTFIQEERIPIRIQQLLKSKSFQSIEEFYKYYERIYLLYCSTLLFPNLLLLFILCSLKRLGYMKNGIKN